ncbi:MAG: zinc ribbon domain-containing protein [Alkalispirochaeta sp.]
MKKFYCEHCGQEVNEQDEVCSHCGAFFVAIKCPRCGYRDKQHRFHNGCPQCGFLSQSAGTSDQWEHVGRTPVAGSQRSPMPSWLFWIVLGALAASFIVLARIYARL